MTVQFYQLEHYNIMAKSTLSYSDGSKGWTSFWSFFPELFLKLNNRFYSIHNGQLWLHNDESAPRGFFYGQKVLSKIKTIFSDSPSEDKIYKTIVLEGNRPWHVYLKTNLTESTIEKEEFNARESRHFSYIRQNENEDDFNGRTVQGIGVIVAIDTNAVTFNSVSNMIAVGDQLYQVNNEVDQLIGTITDISQGNIIVNSITSTPVPGLFCYAKKDPRIEGGEMRGYYMEVELTNNDTEMVELFAINTNAVKSYV